jgi:cob(I)alamin adenosyltransferase
MRKIQKNMCYTGTGDDGVTRSGRGECVSKADSAIQLGGEIDELNSILGMVISLLEASPHIQRSTWKALLISVQRHLFLLGAAAVEVPIREGAVESLKSVNQTILDEIVMLDELLPELREFVLPGGNWVASNMHYCRSVVRRVERQWVGSAQKIPISFNKEAMILLNSLSDLIFMMARFVNECVGDSVR